MGARACTQRKTCGLEHCAPPPRLTTREPWRHHDDAAASTVSVMGAAMPHPQQELTANLQHELMAQLLANDAAD